MGKLSNLGTETSFSLTDLLVKVKSAGGGDVLVTLANLIAAISPAWTTFTPTFNLVGGGSWGNAAFAGSYLQIGKLVLFQASFTLGSTTSFAGLTSVTMNLPVTASSNWPLTTVIGNTFMSAASGFYLGVTILSSTTTAKMWAQIASSTYLAASDLTSTVPAAWASGNVLYVTGTYEAA